MLRQNNKGAIVDQVPKYCHMKKDLRNLTTSWKYHVKNQSQVQITVRGNMRRITENMKAMQQSTNKDNSKMQVTPM